MIKLGITGAALGCAVMLTSTGCGGTSHNESNAQVCAKLKTDAESLQSTESSTNLKQVASQAKSVAGKLTNDAKHAKSSQIRDGVSKVSDALNTLASDLSSGTAPVGSKLTALESKLKSAETELNGQCPQFSSG